MEQLRPAHVVATASTVLAGNIWLLGLANGPDVSTLYVAPALLTAAVVALRRLASPSPASAR